jgi:hypothetical protein
MAKPNIDPILTTQTFQSWFDKTNELAAIFRDSALTAQTGTADETEGDATLLGQFTADDLTAVVKIQTDDLESRTAGGDISVASPVVITPPTEPIAATFNFGASGARTRYTDGDTAWDIGYDNSTNANFQMNQGGGGQFSLSPAGVLTVPSIVTDADVTIGTNLTIPGTLTANNIVVSTLATGDFSGTFAGDFTGDIYAPGGTKKVFENGNGVEIPATMTGNVNGTVSSLTNHDTGDLKEDKNATVSNGRMYFTQARARATLSGGTGVSYTSNTGVIAIGQSVATTADVKFDDMTLTGDLTVEGNATVDGTFSATSYAGDGSALAGIIQLARAHITFDGSTGTVKSSSGGLTMSKSGTGNYVVSIPTSVPGGRPTTNSDYSIIVGNTDDKQTSRANASFGNGTLIESITNFNAWVDSQTTNSFRIRATRTALYYQHFGGNDNNDGATFGITACDPKHISIVILY